MVKKKRIIEGLMIANIISRILLLTDVLSQDGNILFIENNNDWELILLILEARLLETIHKVMNYFKDY